MKIIILGGTGLIGYYSVFALFNKRHSITIVSRGSINTNDLFPDEINSIIANVFEMKRQELINLFTGFDAMVYALGPDERDVPKNPAAVFFEKYLVEKCLIICNCAKEAKLKRLVVLGSYFSFFHRKHPEWKLANNHIYINCRVKQAEECLNLSDQSLTVIILEIPYVFGIMPKRQSLWTELLLPRLKVTKPLLFFTTGGTVMVTANFVGEAVRGAIENGKTGSYTLGEENISWNEMLFIVSKTLGGFRKKTIVVPIFIAQIYAWFEKIANTFKGKEAGLNYPKYIVDFQHKFTYLPEELLKTNSKELKTTRGDVRQAIKETFDICEQQFKTN